MAAIEIRALRKAFDGNEVLKGVDLKAPRGHVVSLIGSSGSGKSTLLRCCNLLEDSQQGEIRFEGEAVRWKGEGLGRHPSDRDQVTRIRTNLSMAAHDRITGWGSFINVRREKDLVEDYRRKLNIRIRMEAIGTGKSHPQIHPLFKRIEISG